jgi:phosphate-selective porin
VVDLNAGAALGIPQIVTGCVYGGKQQIYAVGLNWYLNSNMRVMLDLAGSISTGSTQPERRPASKCRR